MMRWGPIEIIDLLTRGRFSGGRVRKAYVNRSRGTSSGAELGSSSFGTLGAVVGGFFMGLSALARRRWFQLVSAFVGFLVVVDLALGTGGSALIIGGLYALAVGIFGAGLRSRQVRYEDNVREVIAGVVHDRRQAGEGDAHVSWRDGRAEAIFFRFPSAKAGETVRASMEKRMRQMLPEDDGKLSCNWRFKWDLRRREAAAYPVRLYNGS